MRLEKKKPFQILRGFLFIATKGKILVRAHFSFTFAALPFQVSHCFGN